MSWLFGAVHNALLSDLQQRFHCIHSAPIQSYVSEKIYLAFGGLEDTCRNGLFPVNEVESNRGWAVVGSGLQLKRDDCKFLSSDDWQDILRRFDPDLSAIDGHFCALRWNDDSVEVWMDEIGLRTLYVAPLDGGYCFSTRLDWLAQAARLNDISFPELGAAWLLTNKLTYDPPIQKVARVGPGGRARITVDSFTSTNCPWLPEVTDDPNSSVISTLERFVHPVIPAAATLSLGMSGGFDCRLLLSLLMTKRKTSFALHSFGSAKNPDVVIARQMADQMRIPFTQYDDPLPSVDRTISLLEKYVAQTCLASPASSMLKLRYYDRMRMDGKALIDGGYGEISRRQMGNRLLHKGENILREGNPELLFTTLRMHRASIFNHDIEVEMCVAAKREIANAWETMPLIGSIGAENFVDLFLIRTRVANNSPGPQDWIDSQIVNYMPYAQPSFLREVFRTSLTERRNARLYRRVIKKKCSGLSRFPLAKEGITYPYSFTTIPAWVWRTAKEKMGMQYEEPYRRQLLLYLREFVRDIASSDQTRHFPPYHHARILNAVKNFYGGKEEFASEVDWWLTFELWRRGLNSR